MKKYFIAFVAIFVAIVVVIISRIPRPYYKITRAQNMVFIIASNHDGTRIALSSSNRQDRPNDKLATWSLHLAAEDMELTPFKLNNRVAFKGRFLFGTDPDEFFYNENHKGKGSVWKGSFDTAQVEQVFETERWVSHFYPLENSDIVFIGNKPLNKNKNLTGISDWTWFSYSSTKGIKQLTGKDYYYFTASFNIANSIFGFSQIYGLTDLEDINDPRYDKPYLATITIAKNSKAEVLLKVLDSFITSLDSKNEPEITCDKEATVCIAARTIDPEDSPTFEHEFYMVEPSGSKKLDIRLAWNDRFTLSGDGKHLFIVGRNKARAEQYFLQKYSRNEDGRFVFVASKDLSFLVR